MASTGARLRQTFNYDIDSDTVDSSPELDEDEQENIISNLRERSIQQDGLHSLIFTLIPLFFVLPFTFTLPIFPLTSILGITSLLISALRMRLSYSPPQSSHRRSTSALFGVAEVSRWLQPTELEYRLVHAVAEDGPLRLALPWLNGALCTVLCFTAMVLYWRGGSLGRTGLADAKWIFCLVPGSAWGMVEVAIRSMRDMGKAIGELEKLKYPYKEA